MRARLGGKSGRDVLQRFGRFLQMLDGDCQGRIARERGLAAEHVVAGDAERVDVATMIERFALDLLGTHVQRRAHRHADLSELDAAFQLQHASEAEIGHFDLARSGDHDVFGLDVAMDDALIGSFGQGCRSLADHEQRQLQIKCPVAGQVLSQVQSLDVFLGDEMDVVDAGHFVDLDDVGVNQGGGCLGLTTKPLDVGRVGGQIAFEHLEGHLPTERLLFGQVDLGHCTAAESRRTL